MTKHALRRNALAAAALTLAVGAGVLTVGIDGAAGSAESWGAAVGRAAVPAALVAAAQAGDEPTMSMSGSGSATMQPGDTMTVNGAGWQPGSTVTLSMDGVGMASAVADSLGNVAFTIVVPMDMAPGAHTMSMSGFNLAGRASTLTTGVTLGGLAGQLGAAAPVQSQPAMTG